MQQQNNQTTNILARYWQLILAGLIFVALLAGMIIVTTKTDDISANNTVEPTAVARTAVRTPPATTTTSTTSPISSSNRATTTPPADPFAVDIAAESAVVWDVYRQQALYEKQATKEQPLASLTKLMTALVAADTAVDPATATTTISQQHLEAAGSHGLVAGQTWQLDDLIAFMLIESSNDAARAVAAAGSADPADGYAKGFIDKMNNTAERIGLAATYFFNPSGLDLNETLISGGYGTARDVAQLFAYMLEAHSDILAVTTKPVAYFQSREGTHYTAKNTNTHLQVFSNELGSKTGYTVLAGGNLVMGFDFGRPVVIAVLGSTRNGRFADMEVLYNATQQYFTEESVHNAASQNF